MSDLFVLASDPAAWAALVTLIVMEVVLGIDNLIFISILTNRMPDAQRAPARRIGIGLALVLRLVLLSTIAWIAGLVHPVLTLPFTAPIGEDGHAAFDLAFSWRDLILIAGGLVLVWKATREIHENMTPGEAHVGPAAHPPATVASVAGMNFAAAIVQILLLDIVFSIDSILTAVGMTDHLPIMIVAVVVAVGLMLVAANPLADFINDNPSVVMLALGFLLMIGATLIADAFGIHVPKGYIYAAMAFSGLVEGLNMASRRAKSRGGKPHP
jgi:predicted tellurium resistance membrane protein TerC